MSTEKREHIGDGVYVRLDNGWQLELRVSDGSAYGPPIYIEPATWRGLLDWIQSQHLEASFPAPKKER